MSYALFCLMTLAVILVIPGEIMSLEDVKAFYQRLGTDEAFRAQIQGVNSKDECSQTVKCAGYDFTQEELEEYTLQLLELSADEDELADLDEKELATVFGGIVAQPLSEPSTKGLSIRDKLAASEGSARIKLSLASLLLAWPVAAVAVDPSSSGHYCYGVVILQDGTVQPLGGPHH
jgi:predicted ribosomally synthesized peptide with nif11-like leader